MRGVGGPLLCIGDLLSDVGEGDGGDAETSFSSPQHSSSSSSSVANSTLDLQPSDLTTIFQENYSNLTEALAGTDHSWTGLMLKLCIALETANKLIQSTDANVARLSEKVGELESIIKRQDSTIAAAEVIHHSLNQKDLS